MERSPDCFPPVSLLKSKVPGHPVDLQASLLKACSLVSTDGLCSESLLREGVYILVRFKEEEIKVVVGIARVGEWGTGRI